MSYGAKLLARNFTQLGYEVLVCSDVKVQPESPLAALRDVESIDIAENVLKGGWVIVLELDDFSLAFLYTCVRTCFRGVVML
jgi:hypothetical protein